MPHPERHDGHIPQCTLETFYSQSETSRADDDVDLNYVKVAASEPLVVFRSGISHTERYLREIDKIIFLFWKFCCRC